MDEGGVDPAVIHPPALDPNSTALALQAVRDHPRRVAIMGAHDLSSNLRVAASGHEDQFAPPGRIGRCRFGQATFTHWDARE